MVLIWRVRTHRLVLFQERFLTVDEQIHLNPGVDNIDTSLERTLSHPPQSSAPNFVSLLAAI